MSLDKVVEEILRKGEEKRLETIRLGERERDELISIADKSIAEHREKALRQNKAQIEQMEQQELSGAELESKKTLLAAQRQAMEALKADALKDLADYPAERRQKMYSKLVARAKKELGNCYVYSNKSDKALLRLPSGMTYGDAVDCVGGLVFESKDRSVRLDFRFESLLEDAWNKNIQGVYKKLFG